MTRWDHKLTVVVSMFALSSIAAARESASNIAATASMSNPHSLNLELDYRARRRGRGAGRVESNDFLLLSPALRPVRWPRADDVRALLVTPELRRMPLVGWIATNLYRMKENGWCVQADPGEGEYLVFYRFNL